MGFGFGGLWVRLKAGWGIRLGSWLDWVGADKLKVKWVGEKDWAQTESKNKKQNFDVTIKIEIQNQN